MSAALGITRAAVWKRINLLKDDGWPIESAGKRGYILHAHDRLEQETWIDVLTARVLGRSAVKYAKTLPSTNTELKIMAAEGAPHGALCLCEEQTAGRGRLNRTWVSPPGVGLWQSVMIHPHISVEQLPLLSYCAALAMSDALRITAGVTAWIKWPNDLVCGEPGENMKKICGILMESSVEIGHIHSVIIGVGLNVKPGSAPPELKDQAACLADYCEALPTRRSILCAYLARLESWLDALETRGFEPLGEALRRRCVTLGRQVHVTTADGSRQFTAAARDLSPRGTLVLRKQDGSLMEFYAGDVSVRGVMGYA